MDEAIETNPNAQKDIVAFINSECKKIEALIEQMRYTVNGLSSEWRDDVYDGFISEISIENQKIEADIINMRAFATWLDNKADILIEQYQKRANK
jgi:uncharacterized protein YukE